MPFTMQKAPSCVACHKSVYPNDRQIKLDSRLYHMPCAKCTDCDCAITVMNFAVVTNSVDDVTLLCKTHYKNRFNAAGGIYGGSGKYAKKQLGELRATMSPIKEGDYVKASAAGSDSDTNYTLERSVTTPDKRPSLIAANAASAAEAAQKEEVAVEEVADTFATAEISPASLVPVSTSPEKDSAPQLLERRASLKPTVRGSVANSEIVKEAARLAKVDLEAKSPKKEQQGCGRADCPCGADCTCIDCTCAQEAECAPKDTSKETVATAQAVEVEEKKVEEKTVQTAKVEKTAEKVVEAVKEVVKETVKVEKTVEKAVEAVKETPTPTVTTSETESVASTVFPAVEAQE